MKSTEIITSKKAESSNVDIALRRIPYPYKAMLAICSDLDETPDKDVYLEIMRFLNTTEETSIGKGVGLEVGNSIYFDMPQNQFSYWNTDDAGREMVRSLIKSGHIDCLHSYGDLAAKRKQAEKALNELDKYGCKMQVWVDHGIAPTNFGSDIMQGHGDEPGHEAYHADLTCDYGIKYIWRGRVTSITGQDVPASLSGIWNIRHPLASGQTLLKEVTKRKLARLGNEKYSMHQPNKILRKTSLRYGREVYEFMRCNPHWGGISSCDQGRHIAKVLTKDMLNNLMSRGGMCVLYTHLGKIDNSNMPFNQKAVEAFRLLAEKSKREVFVTTAKRLLCYNRAVCEIDFIGTQVGNTLCINIETSGNKNSIFKISEEDLAGMTFYVRNLNNIRMKINGKEIKILQKNPPDETGRQSVSLSWPKLEFPEI